jgi:hypothetical protein
MIDGLELVIVTSAAPFYLVHTGESWKNEKVYFNLVGKFIDSLPSEWAPRPGMSGAMGGIQLVAGKARLRAGRD